MSKTPRPSAQTLRTRPAPLVTNRARAGVRGTRDVKAAIANEDWNSALSGAADPDDSSDVVGETEQPAPLAPPASRFAPGATQGSTQIPHAMAPAQPQPQPRSALALRIATYEDFDRLWDWCRANPEGAVRFLGAAPVHSRALFEYLETLIGLETQHAARVRSIYFNETHIGLATLVPIDRTSAHPFGYAHCFLAPAFHGQLAALMPLLLDEVSVLEPTLTLRVAAHDYAFAKLLEPHGFRTEITLSRPPHVTRG